VSNIEGIAFILAGEEKIISIDEVGLGIWSMTSQKEFDSVKDERQV
jgi:hypothetical protein